MELQDEKRKLVHLNRCKVFKQPEEDDRSCGFESGNYESAPKLPHESMIAEESRETDDQFFYHEDNENGTYPEAVPLPVPLMTVRLSQRIKH